MKYKVKRLNINTRYYLVNFNDATSLRLYVNVTWNENIEFHNFHTNNCSKIIIKYTLTGGYLGMSALKELVGNSKIENILLFTINNL